MTIQMNYLAIIEEIAYDLIRMDIP